MDEEQAAPARCLRLRRPQEIVDRAIRDVDDVLLLGAGDGTLEPERCSGAEHQLVGGGRRIVHVDVFQSMRLQAVATARRSKQFSIFAP